MTFDIRPVYTSRSRELCQQVLVSVFHQELSLFGMKIPDRYDSSSIHMQITHSEDVIGTYRIVLPSKSLGFPIEEVGFDISQFAPAKVCEMSRLALYKERRGTFPFRKIIISACDIASKEGASVLIAAILPQNVPLFKRQGFSQVGPPISDPSVESGRPEASVIVPMQKLL